MGLLHLQRQLSVNYTAAHVISVPTQHDYSKAIRSTELYIHTVLTIKLLPLEVQMNFHKN
jgi:hypothetical protein